MTTKTLKKQLAAAIAMVVVAAVALTSATFAWFVNNGAVQATGMSVNAQTDDSLLIKADKEANYTSVGTTDVAAQTTMRPTTSADGLNFAKLGGVDVKNAHDSAASWRGESGEFSDGDLISVVEAEKTTYYQEAKYQIKSTTANTSFYVSGIDGSYAGSSDIKQAIRVSVTCGSTTKVYKLVQNAANTENQVGTYNASSATGNGWTLVDDTNVYTNPATAANIWTLSTADTPQDVVVRVWFEGQDSKCYTDAIDTANNFGITVNFTKYEA